MNIISKISLVQVYKKSNEACFLRNSHLGWTRTLMWGSAVDASTRDQSRTSYCIGQHTHIQAARAYFLSLIVCSLFFWRSVIFFFSNGVRPLRKALVFFYLKSFGRYLFFLESVLADAILFSLNTVRTLAIDFLTWRILESFTYGCEDTLLTLSWASSF